MIKHVHVNDCDSTQDLLKEQLNNPERPETILVSCENQISGRGRGENKWTAMPGTLCLSLNLAPHKVMSFTALEVSVLVAMFFESRGKALKLKWPNDLWDETQKKCGGILIQGNQNIFSAGIGVNLYSASEEFGAVYNSTFEMDKKVWAKDLCEFILQHRFQSTERLKEEWMNRCGHLGEFVRVTEGSDVVQGRFIGLGEFGEALLQSGDDVLKIYNGSLRLKSQA